MQRRHGSGGVEELELGPLKEDLEPNIRCEEVTVVAEDKVFQRGGSNLPRSTSTVYKQSRSTGSRFARTGP